MKEMACSSRVTVEHLMKGPFTKMLERFQKTNWGQCSLWGQVAAGQVPRFKGKGEEAVTGRRRELCAEGCLTGVRASHSEAGNSKLCNLVKQKRGDQDCLSESPEARKQTYC